MNNGTCINSNPFTCICNSYFTGQRCETAIDPCDTYPCKRGICINLSNGLHRCQVRAI
jgi:hypothetical protein